MEDTYLTLKDHAQGLYRDKGSRFLAFGFPVKNEEEIKSILAETRKKYHDARHHCYAYRLGSKGDIYRASDDGEPSGTAGKPIHGQLVSRGVTMTLAIVVRYFGGILLGTGGLIQAYRSATADMLANAIVIEKLVERKMRIEFPYEMLNGVMKILKDESLVPATSDFSMSCSLTLMVRESLIMVIAGRLNKINGLEIKMED
jgi:uncharacterized YigZ family protein